MANGNVRGCKRSRAWHRARWREHVEACAGSGMSAARYCREHGLNPKRFYRWRRIFAESAGQGHHDANASNADAATPRFAEVQLAPGRSPMGSASSGVELVVPGERRLRLARDFDAETLRRAVSVLESLSC